MNENLPDDDYRQDTEIEQRQTFPDVEYRREAFVSSGNGSPDCMKVYGWMF